MNRLGGCRTALGQNTFVIGLANSFRHLATFVLAWSFSCVGLALGFLWRNAPGIGFLVVFVLVVHSTSIRHSIITFEGLGLIGAAAGRITALTFAFEVLHHLPKLGLVLE